MRDPLLQEEPTPCPDLAYGRLDLFRARVLPRFPLAAHVRVLRASGVVRGRVVWGGAEGWMLWGAFSLRVDHTLSPAFIHSFCSGRMSVFQERHCLGGGPTVLVLIYIFI